MKAIETRIKRRPASINIWRNHLFQGIGDRQAKQPDWGKCGKLSQITDTKLKGFAKQIKGGNCGTYSVHFSAGPINGDLCQSQEQMLADEMGILCFVIGR